MCSAVRFVERFGNCEVEWTEQSAIELLELYNRKEQIWDPKHPMHFNLLTPNVNYSGHTAPLTSKVAFYIFIQ